MAGLCALMCWNQRSRRRVLFRAVLGVAVLVASLSGGGAVAAENESRAVEVAALSAENAALSRRFEIDEGRLRNSVVLVRLGVVVRALAEISVADAFLAQVHHPIQRVCESRILLPVAGAVYAGGLGWAVRPIDQVMRLHDGVDLSAPKGTPVVAADDGVVYVSGVRGGYGNAVYIRHSWGFTRYAHLSSITDEMAPGKTVRRGELVGLVGNTGLAGGNHLHFEVHDLSDEVLDPLGCF